MHRRQPVPHVVQPLLVQPYAVSGVVGLVSATHGTFTITPDPEEPDVAQDLVGPWLAQALVCAENALTVPVGRAVLVPGGPVAWDDCCEGQVWVRLISMTPSGNPATLRVNAQTTPCGVLMWTVTVGIGVIRCTPTVKDNGDPPTVAELVASALAMTQDMADLSEGIQCCLAPQMNKVTIQRWDPLGPEGGCAGGEWTATLLIDNCRCP